MTPYTDSTENADKLARGELVMYRFGRAISYRLTPKQMVLYESAKENHFVISNNVPVADVYYLWCCGAKIPYVKIRNKIKWATVAMDLLPCPQRACREMLHELRCLFQRYGRDPAVYSGLGGYSYFDVLRENAEYVAETLWAIGTAPRAAYLNENRQVP